jgi:sugar-specific transcriptional regulator TrmB/MFS family permease
MTTLKLNTKQVFLFFVIIFFSIVIALVPDIISDDFATWSEKTFGRNYKWILIALFLIGTVTIIYLTSDSFPFFRKSKKEAWKDLTITWSPTNTQLAQQAKKEIKSGELEKALDCLFKIEVPELHEEATQLASQLAQNERQNSQGVLSHEKYTISQNRLSKRILNLISAVEKSLQHEDEINTKIKDYLAQRYQNRLDQKLAGRQPINLRKVPSTEGTNEETSSYFVSIDQEDVQGTIQNIFDEANGRLLIIGVPGSGKTVLMLQLVLALLKNKTAAIPVVLNLATWQGSYRKLEDWLEKILPAELGVNSVLAKKVMEEIPLILLLDGLDEVKETERKSCLEAIGFYGAEAQKQFVITSRKKEYSEAVKDAPVYLQIEVGPFELDQIKAELKQIGFQQPEAPPLLKAIESDQILSEVVKTPIYFNLLQLLFGQGKRLSDLTFQTNDISDWQKKLTEYFLVIQLASTEEKWINNNIDYWISFLASRMNKRNIVVFELRDLQYDWWVWSRRQSIFGFICESLIDGLPFGLFFSAIGAIIGSIVSGAIGLIWGMMIGVLFGVFFGGFFLAILGTFLVGSFIAFIAAILEALLVPYSANFENPFLDQVLSLIIILGIIVGCLVGGLYGIHLSNLGRQFPYIETKGKRNGTWENFISNIRKSFIAPLKRYYLFLITIAISISFIQILIETYYSSNSSLNIITLTITTIISWIILIPGVPLIAGILGGIYDIIFIEYASIIQINTPYQRFNASMRSLHFSILQHWLLRYQLSRKGLLPLRLVDFLNEMTKAHIMESDGATWRFRHRIIQDYFAEQWEEKYAEEREVKKV